MYTVAWLFSDLFLQQFITIVLSCYTQWTEQLYKKLPLLIFYVTTTKEKVFTSNNAFLVVKVTGSDRNRFFIRYDR